MRLSLAFKKIGAYPGPGFQASCFAAESLFAASILFYLYALCSMLQPAVEPKR